MGNTVGSQRNLSKRQKEILIGSILGDGTLEKDGKNVRLRIEHGKEQKAYLWWKYKELKALTSKPPRLVKVKDKRSGKERIKWHFSTLSLPVLNFYYEKFYQKRRKQIPKDIEELLTSPLSLAVWFMDDGYKRSDCNALRINTDCFKLEEQERLKKCLKKNFDINVRLHRKGKDWNIYIPNKESKKFCQIVKSHFHPSLRYKISLTP